MRTITLRIGKALCLGLAALALGSCGGGGGGDGGFSGRPLIEVKISADQSGLPVNPTPVIHGNPSTWPNPGGPYTNTITVQALQDNRPFPAASISVDLLGPNGSGALYYLDGDPDHEDCEDFDGVELCVPLAYRRLVFEDTTGFATFHFHSGSQASTVRLVATVTDPTTGQSIHAEMTLDIGSGANTGVPATVQFRQIPALYIQGQGRADVGTLELGVFDDGGFPTDAAAGVNNLRVELLPGRPNAGEQLSASGAAGNQTGEVVSTFTRGGIAQVGLRAGTRPGTVLIRATADRADNNVDNGIQSPVAGTAAAVIADGSVVSLTFTGAFAGAVANYFNALPSGPGDSFNAVTGVYERTISVVAADEFGNPPPAGTPITLRLIDSPATGYPDQGRGNFVISGGDGNPAEGGAIFTTLAPIPSNTGCPAVNAILVVDGLRPYQSGSRIITGFNANTLSVNTPFFEWVDTGFSVPYVVGCVPHFGNVDSVAFTDAKGVASFTMRYPVTQLGRNFILTAEAAGGKAGAVMRHWYLGEVENASLRQINGSDTITLGNPECTGDGAETDCTYSGTTSVRLFLTDGNGQPLPAETLAVEIRANADVLTQVQNAIANAQQELEEIAQERAATDCTADPQACAELDEREDAAQRQLDRALAILAALLDPPLTITPEPVRTGANGVAEITIAADGVPGGAAYDLVFATVGPSQNDPNPLILSDSLVIKVVAPGNIDVGDSQ
ncbi:MAG TPA: hypothetical protein VNN09_08380 [Candidatus Competibacteraceae bacterium]|nr:hypothetical protein [Candidatus Competibacteraceae bacterium]